MSRHNTGYRTWGGATGSPPRRYQSVPHEAEEKEPLWMQRTDEGQIKKTRLKPEQEELADTEEKEEPQTQPKERPKSATKSRPQPQIQQVEPTLAPKARHMMSVELERATERQMRKWFHTQSVISVLEIILICVTLLAVVATMFYLTTSMAGIINLLDSIPYFTKGGSQGI